MNETAKALQRSGLPAPNLTEQQEEELHREEMLDEALRGTFPASDPLAVTEPGAHSVVAAGHRRAAA